MRSRAMRSCRLIVLAAKHNAPANATRAAESKTVAAHVVVPAPKSSRHHGPAGTAATWTSRHTLQMRDVERSATLGIAL